MIIKEASFSFTDINPLISDSESVASSSGERMMRTASGRVVIEPGSDKAKIVEAEIKKHPNALFFRAKAIEADCPNTNGDYFSWDELLDSYKSFEGVPFFTNHDNQNVENARGKVIFAEAVPEEKAIYTISFIDRDAYPHICRSIEEEYVTGVSMGCSVEYSVCNICGNKAEKTEDYCSHISNKKGRKFTGRSRDVVTGEEKTFNNESVFEYNYGLKFIELSAVVDPACPNCHIEGIITNDDYLAKVASFENQLHMIRTAALEKEASQEEINQIEQCLETLEQIAVNLIHNRQQVEMEFSSDLVKIMSDLQTWLDELVGAGYGNVQSAQVPGTVGNAPEEMGEAMPAQGLDQGVPSVSPVSMETETDVGSVSGSPTTPATQVPELPITAPVKPKLSNFNNGQVIQRISDVDLSKRMHDGNEILRHASSICKKMNKIGEIEMGGRRTSLAKKMEKENAIEVLSNSWEEKQSFFEYIKKVPSIQNNEHRLSVSKNDDSFIIVAEDKESLAKNIWTYEDLTNEQRQEIIDSPEDAAVSLLNTFAKSLNNQKEGVKKMTDINKNAGATTVQEVPDQVQEGQLDRQDLYHARQNDDKHSTTQKQLEEKRRGEQDVLTESQLDNSDLKLNPRSDSPSEVTEAQFSGDNRFEEDQHSITQSQLEGNRVNNEPNQVTEGQLNETPSPWSRTSGRDVSLFKSASDHMLSVIDVMADVSIKTGCTPEETHLIASSLVDSLESRYNLGVSLLEEKKEKEDIDYAKRVAFWQNKNLKVASSGRKEIAESIVDGLRHYASNDSYNPDILIDAIDVLTEDKGGVESISSKIEEKLAKSQEDKVHSKSRKQELREALSKKDNIAKTSLEERDDLRKNVLASMEDSSDDASDSILNPEGVKNADTVIEASFNEVGTEKNSPDFKKDISSFARGALASQNLRLASITNVTISGDTIQIAVQTDTEENEVNIDTGEGTTEIPIGGEAIAPVDAETVNEGDLSGEGLESSQGAWASSEDKMVKEAQAPMGGGMDAPGGVSAPGAPEQGLPGAAPSDDAIQTLTTGLEEEADIPTTGDRQMPWTICPECGSNDVDVSEEEGDISGSCNACGAQYEALVKKTVEFSIKKPTKSVGEEGVETPEAPESPEVPALPVAAQTSLGKDSIVRIASNKEKHGHVCPACGETHCKADVEAEGHTEFRCDSCGTDVQKDLLVKASNPEIGYLRVQWNVFPEVDGCDSCKEKAEKFASQIKAGSILKEASKNSKDFPMGSCMERLARQYGGDTVATFGPCKGKLLTECVCGELQKLGFRKIRHMNKLASISVEKDPYDECIEDQTKNENYSLKEAEAICNCIKKRFASELTDNVYVQAFSDDIEKGLESDLKVSDLIALDEMIQKEKQMALDEEQMKLASSEEEDIGSALPALDSIEVEAEIEEEIVQAKSKEDDCDDCDDCGKELCDGCGKCCECDDCCCKDDDMEKESGMTCSSKEETIEKEASDEVSEKVESSNESEEVVEASAEVDIEQEKQLALAMNSKRVRNTNEEVLKMASTPKQVKDIEGDVEAGVPRSKGTLGNEGSDNIDVPMASPDVPRANAEMGNEGASNINPKAGLPDVAVDSSYMGKEKEVQKNMPAINNEIKGTVIADSVEVTLKDGRIEHVAKKMKEVDTVEGDVEAGVPRSKSNIGNEGSDNIDVPMASPDVPRANAEMGNEGSDNINPKADGPDVPIDSSYMGKEKEVQKDMPGINDEMLKQVQQKRKVQLDRIANARKNEAIQTAAWLVANKRVASDKETFDTVVQALVGFETDQIQSMANRMFPEKSVKTSSSSDGKVVEAGHSIPAIVQESAPMSNGDGSNSLTDKLSNAFTIGNTKFDKDLTIYGEK